MKFSEWMTAIANAYWDINFEEFCKRAGFTQDSYAEEKWVKWQALADSLNAFDTNTLGRIVGVSE